MLSTILPPCRTRVRNVDLYQSQIASRCILEFASWLFLIGSSMIASSAPRPVIGPRTPTDTMPPLRPRRLHAFAALERLYTCTLNNSGPHSSRMSRALRPHDEAYSAA